MPRLWEERVGGSAEMGHGARRGEEAVGGSGRWGYRTEDDGEGVQRQGIGGRGTGRSREERWTLEKQRWMYIQLIVRFTLGTSDFHCNEIVLISQGIWVANIFFLNDALYYIQYLPPSLKKKEYWHQISTTQLKKKEYCPQLKLRGYPPLSWPGKEAYILNREPRNMNIPKTAKESKWRDWKGNGWGFVKRFFLKDCRGVFVYSDRGPLGRLAGVILLTLIPVCYTLMSFAFFFSAKLSSYGYST